MSDGPGFFADEDPDTVPPRRLVRRRIADALRVIVDRLVDTDAPDADLERAADGLEAWAETLDGYHHGRSYDGYSEASTGGGSPSGHYDYSPIIGRANPLAPPLDLRQEGDRVIGEVTFSAAYEGAPGCVHGGFVAAAFDEVMGATQALTGNPGMTGTLTIRYESPTPLRVPLRFEAWVDRTEGRKIFVLSELFAGDTRCAVSDGVFISIDFSKLAALEAERNRGSD